MGRDLPHHHEPTFPHLKMGEEYFFVGLLWELEILCIKHIQGLEKACL